MTTSYGLGVNAFVVRSVEFAGFAGADKETDVVWALRSERPPNGVT